MKDCIIYSIEENIINVLLTDDYETMEYGGTYDTTCGYTQGNNRFVFLGLLNE